MKKIFVLDTNILLSDPNSIHKFEDNDIVIPISVIEEVDHFKKDQSETGRNARQVSRNLDKLRKKGTLSSGVPLTDDKDSGLLFVHLGYDTDCLPSLLENSTDNHILSIALNLQKKFESSRQVLIITKDSNLRIKSDAFGINSEDFEADKVDISDIYSGVRRIQVDATVINTFSKNKNIIYGDESDRFFSNEFIVFENKQDPKHKLCGVYDSSTKTIQSLEGSMKNVWGISPRNIEQKFAIWALLNDDIKLVTLSGGAGTGKTLMAIASGLLKTTDEDKYHRLLVARPIFPLGKDLGFLPGDLDEKLNPWMQPIFDSLDFLLGAQVSNNKQKRATKSYSELINQGLLTVEPLTYIRGRSLPQSFFVVDESQNLTPHEIKTILTRAGEGTKIVLTGDPYQIDNPYVDTTNNGLTHVIERFRSSPISAHITLKQGERSQLATLAAELL